MKTYRSAFALIFALLLPGSSLVFGQGSHSMRVNVSATVMNDIELSTIRNMQFGDVQPGQQVLTINPVLDPQAGKMIASGIPNSMIRVSYISEWELNNPAYDQSLVFFYQVAGSDTDNQNTSELLQTENRGLKFNENGEFYFWIGGRVNIANAVPGTYEGEFTIEIEYM